MNNFGNDDNVMCFLFATDGSNDEHSFFEAYLAVPQSRRNWLPKVFWANAAQSHKVLVLCRTRSIKDRVQALTNIEPQLAQTRIQQANNAGFTSYTVRINDTVAMIYY